MSRTASTLRAQVQWKVYKCVEPTQLGTQLHLSSVPGLSSLSGLKKKLCALAGNRRESSAKASTGDFVSCRSRLKFVDSS